MMERKAAARGFAVLWPAAIAVSAFISQGQVNLLHLEQRWYCLTARSWARPGNLLERGLVQISSVATTGKTARRIPGFKAVLSRSRVPLRRKISPCLR